MPITNTTIQDLIGGDEKRLNVAVNMILSETNELVQSGLAARGPEVDEVASGGPRKASLAFLNPLSTDEVNVSSDNINEQGDVGSMSADEFMVLRHDLNYAWGTADLTRFVTQYDDRGGVRAGIADYQNGIDKKLLTSGLKGAKAAVANNTSITFNETADFDMAAIYDAIATAEEWSPLFNVMLISHGRYAKLQASEKGFVSPAQTNTRFANYQGFTLLKTNTLTDNDVVVGRSGAVAYGQGAVQTPFEVERKANGGAGGGADILHSRFSRVVHIQGMDYKGAIPTKATLYTNLEAAASWGLKVPAEQFGFRVVKFNQA